MEKQMAQNDQLHSIESAGRFLGGISPSTIRVWLWRGTLTRIKIGRRTMIRESELRALIKPEASKAGDAYAS
jgi:Helix-turn-helix domain